MDKSDTYNGFSGNISFFINRRTYSEVSVWFIHFLAEWVECSPMVGETGVQSQVASYQRL